MSQTRVLVTGADGFIGRHLCRRLVERGYDVLGTVRNGARSEDGYKLVATGDIGRVDDWTPMVRNSHVVVHLAAKAHVMHETPSDALEFRRVNVTAVDRLVRDASSEGVRLFILMSSIGVVTDRSREPVAESHACNPATAYARSKLEAEQSLAAAASDGGMNYAILRPPLVYGPNAPGNFGRLVAAILKSVPLPFGGIRNRRSFIYVGNLAESVVSCIDHDGELKDVFHVSDGEDLSTTELIREIACTAHRRALLFSVPTSVLRISGRLTARQGMVDRLIDSLVVDATKIRSTLGWRPRYSVSQALAETMAGWV